MAKLDLKINKCFENYITHTDSRIYLVIGGYGSGKSYHTAIKLILSAAGERRKILCVRRYGTDCMKTCFELLVKILESFNWLGKGRGHVTINKTEPAIYFPNGSKFIFAGVEDVSKLKSLPDVSDVWVEECSEIRKAAFDELQGRLRMLDVKLHTYLTCNPIGRANWVYKTFFVNRDENGVETVYQNEDEYYTKKCIVKFVPSVGCQVYYHHSTAADNCFVTEEYRRTLDSYRSFDPDLWRTARLGRFGNPAAKVLPQFEIIPADEMQGKLYDVPENAFYYGMDFGFETSYNAVVSMAVDFKRNSLLIFDEIYQNHVTDNVFANHPKMLEHLHAKHMISADCAEPKAIQYYCQCGYRMRRCKKIPRYEQVKKIKRFEHIYCSENCRNVINELETLEYKKERDGSFVYDDFNIDPHTFSAIWYALDTVELGDGKGCNSRPGNSFAGVHRAAF